MSSFACELGKLLHYDLSLSTAYHPQSDGETERVNQEVEIYLRIFCGNNPTSWSKSISHAEFTHNHCPHSVTNQSLFYLMMGYEPRALPSVISDISIPTVESCLKTLQRSPLCSRTRTTSHELPLAKRFQTFCQRRQGLAGSPEPKMFNYQPQVCSQAGRTIYCHQSLIANRLPTPTTKDLEDPSGLPRFPLIALS